MTIDVNDSQVHNSFTFYFALFLIPQKISRDILKFMNHVVFPAMAVPCPKNSFPYIRESLKKVYVGFAFGILLPLILLGSLCYLHQVTTADISFELQELLLLDQIPASVDFTALSC